MIPIFPAAGFFGSAIATENQMEAVLARWMGAGVVYAAFFFLLGPTRSD
jgi:hypothetical protein